MSKSFCDSCKILEEAQIHPDVNGWDLQWVERGWEGQHEMGLLGWNADGEWEADCAYSATGQENVLKEEDAELTNHGKREGPEMQPV